MKILVAALIFLVSSCTQKQSTDLSAQSRQEIIDADIAMSNLATKEGFYNALLKYAEDSMIIPREGFLPYRSKQEASVAWKEKSVIKELTWKPIRAEASKFGDMGYTFGFSTYRGKDTVTHTNYCTIWRKQSDGTWKFIYDAGNNTPLPPTDLYQ